MNAARMAEITEDVFDRVRDLRETKGEEYATVEDTLSDFKEVGEDVDSSPLKVWATYVKKHQRAIDTFIREGSTKSESIESRVIDVIVYHLLFLGLIEDEREAFLAREKQREFFDRIQEGPNVMKEGVAGEASIEPSVPMPAMGPDPSLRDILLSFKGRYVNTKTTTELQAVLRECGYHGRIETFQDRGVWSIRYIEEL